MLRKYDIRTIDSLSKLFYLLANQFLFFLLTAVCLTEKQHIPIV
jgi:hypothetical protein